MSSMTRVLLALLIAANLVVGALLVWQTMSREVPVRTRPTFNAEAVRVVREPAIGPPARVCFTVDDADEALRERIRAALPGARLSVSRLEMTRYVLATDVFPAPALRTARLAELRAAGHARARAGEDGAIVLDEYDTRELADEAREARGDKALPTRVVERKVAYDILRVELNGTRQAERVRALAREAGREAVGAACK